MQRTILSFWLLTGMLAGQQSLPPPNPPQDLPSIVTLEQATKEALEKNLDLMAERYSIDVAKARMITARLRPNPVMTVSADHLDMLGTGFNTVNNAGPNEVAYRTDFVLERGGKRDARIALAEVERSLAEMSLLNAVRGVIYDVASAFVDVQHAKENLTLAQENLVALNGIVDVNIIRVRAGDLAQVELVRSQVAALELNSAAQQAALKLKQARNQLQLLMGRPAPDDAFDIEGPMRRDSGVVNLADLRSQALRLRPDLQGLTRSQARSVADLRLQIAQGKVDYTVGSEFRRQQGVAGTGNSMGFFVSLPLPVFSRNQGEIERARLEREQASARIRALEARIGMEVDNAYRQYATSRSLLEGIEENMLEKARAVRATTEYSYRRGEATLIEFLDAQRAFNDAIQSHNLARADFARSLYLLDAITGRNVNP
jgi:cobalt-zinc-cadmium efflux system outer membrane protein